MTPLADRPSDAVSITEAAWLQKVGVRLYDVAPGEQLPKAYHYHGEQKEVFYVADGAIRVETPDGEPSVSSGQFFVASPGDPHRAFTPEDAAGPATVGAIGAPAAAVHHYEG